MRELIRGLLDQAKIVVFDFDGTLVDSNPIKWEAFRHCFAEYPEELETILAYCHRYNHTPRQQKFRHVFEGILNIPYTVEIERNMLDRYARHTTEQVIVAPTIPGAMEFLQKTAASHDVRLLSSTPHEVLMTILARRGLQTLFKEVQGAPVDKAAWLAVLAERAPCSPAEILFIGDALEDHASAAKAEVPFIGIGQGPWIAGTPAIADFRPLLI